MQKTLRKILEELKTEKPDISFIRGMLEVLVEEEPTMSLKTPTIPVASSKPIMPMHVPKDDEASVIEAYGKAMAGKIDVSAITTEN